MRPGHLRPGTAKAAAKARAKQSTRLSPGRSTAANGWPRSSRSTTWPPEPRTVEDIIAARKTTRRGEKTRRPGPVVTGKWSHANVTDDIPAVVATMFDEAERRDRHHERTRVALIDGNNTQIDAITAQGDTRKIKVTILIDFMHVLEYLWKAAWTFFCPGDPDAGDRVAGHARTVLAGRGVDAATTITHQGDTGITHQGDTGRFHGTERTGADEASAYLRRKAPYLDYPTALANGWQIATGIIEGATRSLIKDRMDITGARWTVPGTEAVLRPRAVIANDDLDDYWPWHQHQEPHRNHLDHYQQLDLAA